MVFVVDPLALPLPRQNPHSAVSHNESWHPTAKHAKTRGDIMHLRVRWFPHEFLLHFADFLKSQALQSNRLDFQNRWKMYFKPD